MLENELNSLIESRFELLESLIFETIPQLENKIAELEKEVKELKYGRSPAFNVKVSYDGKYPSLCNGTLTIWCDDKPEPIYSKKYVCSSTGAAYFDSRRKAQVKKGTLIWEEAKNWPTLAKAVEEYLERYDEPCCGGCL